MDEIGSFTVLSALGLKILTVSDLVEDCVYLTEHKIAIFDADLTHGQREYLALQLLGQVSA